jgi:TorA maturation chaperone TorD
MSEFDLDQAVARENLCRYLSACFYEPGPEFIEEGLFDSMRDAAARIDPEVAEQARKLGQLFADQDLQTLLVDYARLFLGPMRALASPYGWTWLKTPEGDEENAALAVLDLYRAGGFEVDEELLELPDHVALELEFLYLLIFTCNEAQRLGRADDLAAGQRLQARFLQEHLGAWIEPFAAAVRAGAETGFYRLLADMAERFVRLEEARPAASIMK